MLLGVFSAMKMHKDVEEQHSVHWGHDVDVFLWVWFPLNNLRAFL